VQEIASRARGKARTKRAKLGACRLVIQSRIIEQYLRTNVKQESAQTVCFSRLKSASSISKRPVNKATPHLACNTFLPEESSICIKRALKNA
jgi:hypothetical protein